MKGKAIWVWALGFWLMISAWPGSAQVSRPVPENISAGFELLDQARGSLDKTKLLTAEKIFAQCLEQDPDQAHCLYGLARANLYLCSYYREVKNNPAQSEAAFVKAQAAASRAAALLPSNGQVHALLGRLYQMDAALHPFSSLASTMTGGSPIVSEYRRALELDPDNFEAEIGLGSYYLFAPKVAGGGRERALKHFRRAVQLAPHDPEALTWLAVAYREGGDLASARQFLDQALAVDPAYRFARHEELRLKAAEQKRGDSSG